MSDDKMRDAEEAVRVTPTASPTVYTGPRGRPRDDLSRSASSAASDVSSIGPEPGDPETASEDRRLGALGGAGDMGGVSSRGSGGRRPPSAREARASVHNKKNHDPRPASRGRTRKQKFTHDTSKYVFPPVSMSQRAYKEAFARELRALADAKSYGKVKKSLYRRATAYELCGAFTAFRVCDGCNDAREASGVQTSAENAYPCRCRTCGLCSRRESGSKRKRLLRILRGLKRQPGFGFRMITLQTAYNPEDPADVAVEAIEGRLEGAAAAMRSAWTRYLKSLGGGLFWTLEIGRCGFVHAHALHYGPWIDQEAFERAARRGYPAAAKTWIEYLGDDPESEKHRAAIFEVCKYVCKGPSPLSESWIDGIDREVTHPIIAARWEVASLGKHILGYHGVFRHAPTDEDCAATDDDHARDQEDRVNPSEKSDVEVDAEATAAGNPIECGDSADEHTTTSTEPDPAVDTEGNADRDDRADKMREPERPDDDRHLACTGCGSVGCWRWEVRHTSEFVRKMHARRKRAFFRSKWKPPCNKSAGTRSAGTRGFDFVFISRKQYTIAIEEAASALNEVVLSDIQLAIVIAEIGEAEAA